jgi:PTS system galactitol-specific IIA component
MSDKSFINAQAIMTRLKAESSTEVIKVLGDKLCVLGYVNENYVPAVIQRESVYPTGLMLGGKYNVAIPHTDTKYVHNAGIAFASLENPVIFKNMGDPASDVETNMVFLLAVKDPKDQVEFLQKLTDIFQQEELMNSIYETRDVLEVEHILNKQLGIVEV